MPPLITGHNNIGGSRKYFQRWVWKFPVCGKNPLVLIFLDLFSLCRVGALSPLKEKHPSTTSKTLLFKWNQSSEIGHLQKNSQARYLFFSNHSIHALWYVMSIFVMHWLILISAFTFKYSQSWDSLHPWLWIPEIDIAPKGFPFPQRQTHYPC